jgi:hypothetical protein
MELRPSGMAISIAMLVSYHSRARMSIYFYFSHAYELTARSNKVSTSPKANSAPVRSPLPPHSMAFSAPPPADTSSSAYRTAPPKRCRTWNAIW